MDAGGISIWQLLILALPLVCAYVIYRIARTRPPAQPHAPGPKGVAGWLLFLAFALMILGPLIGAVRMSGDISATEAQFPEVLQVAAWHQYKFSAWVLFLIGAGVSFYAGLGLMWGRKPQVVSRARILLWVSGPGFAVLMGFVLPLAIFGQVVTEARLFGALLGSVLGATLWTAYLSRSKRVQATYYPPATEQAPDTPVATAAASDPAQRPG